MPPTAAPSQHLHSIATHSTGEPASARVAVCLVGGLRSIDDTAASLNSNLLAHWDADAFVVGLTPGEPSDTECDRLKGPGPRVVRVTIGPASRVLDQQLLQATQSAPLMQQAHLVHAEPQTDWTRRFAEQFLTRKACRDLVIEHEQQTGRKYEAYARVRLDTFLLEPFPRYFLQHIASRQELHGIEDPAIVRTRPGARQLDPDAPLLAGVVPSVITQASSLVSSFLQSGRVSTELVRFGQLGTSGWASLLTKRSPGVSGRRVACGARARGTA